MLDEEQLSPTDKEILELLRQGRVTAPYVAHELDRSLEYIRSRLRRFIEHDHVERVHEGLYELVDDPVDNSEHSGLNC